MSSLKDRFSKLKTSIVGTQTSDIDAKLDKAVKDIISYKSQASQSSYIELLRQLISKTNGFSIDNQGGIFNQGALTPATFGQGNRLLRYKTYEAIVSNISWCRRALDVLTDNILAPDDITKISLEVTPMSFLEDEIDTEAKTKHVREVIKRIKLEKYLDRIIKATLEFGDFFCEIADAKTALTSKSLLAEGFSRTNKNTEEFTVKVEKKDFKFTMDYSTYIDEAKSEFGIETKKEIRVENLVMVLHNPSRVLKLQSDVFPLSFGYLIFPKYSISPQDMFQDQAVNQICISILKSLETRIPQIRDIGNTAELKDIIASMVQNSDYTSNMNIRYVPPDRMQHFMIPSNKYLPYGESIFDSCQFSAKVLIALETALAIQRLARSTEKRKIAIEVGLPRDARVLIEKLKEEFRKRKVSLDSFGTVDTIPSMITTFEDIYIPQKDGKPFVDISTFTEGNVDTRSKVDELKFLRDSVVACLGIPASFLNIEENLSNKAALGEENILFARTIIGHQKYLTHQICEFIEKIYSIINPEEALTLLDNVQINLPPPKSLQFEREARYIGDLANLVRTLDEIGIPKEWAMKKYLTSIDWSDLAKYEIDEKIDKSLGTKKEEEDGMGGIGGGMGGNF